MTWDYRWAETSAQYTDIDVEWPEDADEPDE